MRTYGFRVWQAEADNEQLAKKGRQTPAADMRLAVAESQLSMKFSRSIKLRLLVAASALVLAGCSSPDLLVLDANGNPLSGAKVVGTSLSMSGKTTMSNKRGEARIPWSIQETKWVSVYKDGFVPIENVSVDQKRPIVIKMRRTNG